MFTGHSAELDDAKVSFYLDDFFFNEVAPKLQLIPNSLSPGWSSCSPRVSRPLLTLTSAICADLHKSVSADSCDLCMGFNLPCYWLISKSFLPQHFIIILCDLGFHISFFPLSTKLKTSHGVSWRPQIKTMKIGIRCARVLLSGNLCTSSFSQSEACTMSSLESKRGRW